MQECAGTRSGGGAPGRARLRDVLLQPFRFVRERRAAARRDQFAGELCERLQETARGARYVYERASFTLVEQESGARFPLGAAFRSYDRASEQDAEALLAEIRRELRGAPVPLEFERARPGLRLEVRCRAAHELARLAGASSLPVVASFSEHLVIALMYEEGSGRHACPPDLLETWGCSRDAAFNAALEASRAESLPRFDAAQGGLRVAHVRSRMGAVLLRIEELLDDVAFEGEPILMAPDTDLLIVADSGDERSVQAMATFATGCRANRALPPIALRPTSQGCHRYEARDGKLAMQLRALEIPFELAAFERQHQLLSALQESGRPSVLRAESGPDGSPPHTICRWTRPGDVLLPVTDSIELPAMDGGENPVLAWSEVMAKIGDQGEATEYYPPRVRMRRLPTADELLSLTRADSTP